MNYSSQQKNDMINYIAMLLNINTGNTLVIDDMFEEIEKLKDLSKFKDFIKNEIKNPTYTQYSNGFQKFLKICEAYQPQVEVTLDQIEYKKVYTFSENLYSKLTWYFDELKFLMPTKEQLDRQIWKNHSFDGKDMINEKESIVCDMIGDTFEIYRLVTTNKPILEARINDIVTNLSVAKKKEVLGVSIGLKSDSENKMIKLIKGK